MSISNFVELTVPELKKLNCVELTDSELKNINTIIFDRIQEEPDQFDLTGIKVDRTENIQDFTSFHKHEPSNSLKFKCEICMMLFSDKEYFREHLEVHAGKRPFQCDICPRAYALDSDLKRHKRQHDSFKCKICFKKFTDFTSLQIHKKMHPEYSSNKCTKKKKKCDICNKEFSDHLNRHLQRHLKQREIEIL